MGKNASRVIGKQNKLIRKLKDDKLSELYEMFGGEGNLNEKQKTKIRRVYIYNLLAKKISLSRYHNLVEAKGGISLISSLGIAYNTTRDFDLNWLNDIDNNELIKVLEDIFQKKIPEDEFVVFRDFKITKNRIRENGTRKYEVQLLVKFYDDAPDPLKIDFGCQDATLFIDNPKFRTIFGEETRIKNCPVEVTIADKIFAAFVSKEGINFSRVKDYFAIYRLFNSFRYSIKDDLVIEALNIVFPFRQGKINFDRCYKTIKDLNSEKFVENAKIFFEKNNEKDQFVKIETLQWFLEKIIKWLEKNKEKIINVVDDK